MFKEIKNEFLSITNTDVITKLSNIPTKPIAKVLDLIYNINIDSVERVYQYSENNYTRVVVIYNSDEDTEITHDVPLIEGKICHLIAIPSHLINITPENIVNVIKTVIHYVAIRVSIISNENALLSKSVTENIFDLVTFQAVPVLVSSIMKELYTSPVLPTIIYEALSQTIESYKHRYSETGIRSLFKLFSENVDIDELLDNNIICSTKEEHYPGIWYYKEINESGEES